ncbi:hypothetical protein Agub_g9734 [Astrephomene gubernaculifera]|uniref:Uncharacterized protein n=1 Tax=Astrephomene gubernaculifera TaxID=47775 RepID=A0AAD3HPA0_9CHLO|nr:hypothetical protein Agub_g9734 [Astrephomene gubernaculifera]
MEPWECDPEMVRALEDFLLQRPRNYGLDDPMTDLSAVSQQNTDLHVFGVPVDQGDMGAATGALGIGASPHSLQDPSHQHAAGFGSGDGAAGAIPIQATPGGAGQQATAILSSGPTEPVHAIPDPSPPFLAAGAGYAAAGAGYAAAGALLPGQPQGNPAGHCGSQYGSYSHELGSPTQPPVLQHACYQQPLPQQHPLAPPPQHHSLAPQQGQPSMNGYPCAHVAGAAGLAAAASWNPAALLACSAYGMAADSTGIPTAAQLTGTGYNASQLAGVFPHGASTLAHPQLLQQQLLLLLQLAAAQQLQQQQPRQLQQPSPSGASEPGLRQPLAESLKLRPSVGKPQQDTVVSGVGRLLAGFEEGGSCSLESLAKEWQDNPDPERQFAFLAADNLDNERSNMNAVDKGRQPVQLDEKTYVVSHSGGRCTCEVTYCDKCKDAGHEYDTINKYLLAFKEQPSGREADKLTFRGDIKLWVPKQPRAVLWHVKPRVRDPKARSRSKRTGTAEEAAAAASEETVPEAAARRHQTGGKAAAASRRRDAKRTRTATHSPATAAGAVHAAGAPQHPQPGSPQVPGPGAAEVAEAWFPSLEDVFNHLQGCGPPAAFQQLLLQIPLDHLLQMRCPRDGQCIAHLLVTPPRQLAVVLGRRDDDSQPPWDPDEGMLEKDAVQLIKVFILHLENQLGPGKGVQAWRQLLQQQDGRHMANAVHRAGRFGHRLAVLQECVLPYASRSALLQVTAHLYTPFHSAFRTGREDAGRLLLGAALAALRDVAACTDPCVGSVLLKTAAGSSAPLRQLACRAVYLLKNKYFRGTNKDGYRSPDGRSGYALLSAACQAELPGVVELAGLAVGAGASGSGGTLPGLGSVQVGPELSFPAPPPLNKKNKQFDLGKLSMLVDILDYSQPRPMAPLGTAAAAQHRQ